MTHPDDALLPLDAVRPAAAPFKGAPEPAPALPVARVAVDNPLPHLDRPFDYLVPASMHESAQPGVRVRVRFAGKLVDGFLLERVEQSDHPGRLATLERVTSPERVLTPEIAGLARAVADRYAGTLADVLRLAVPPRHAKAEAETPAATPTDHPGEAAAAPTVTAPTVTAPTVTAPTVTAHTVTAHTVTAPGHPGTGPADEGVAREAAAEGEGADPGVAGRGGGHTTAEDGAAGPGGPAPAGGPPAAGEWGAYPMGASFLDALRNGRAPRAVWQALPGAGGWPGPVAEAVRATLEGGRGAVVVVPDGKDVALADAALTRVLGPGAHVALTADLGPAERYRRWLRLLRGQVKAVVGTRAAMFAPVADLGLVAIWDDGDDLHAERLAPYPHAREVLALRAHRSGAAVLVGGYTRTAEATQLIATRWARPIVAARQTIRSRAPRVRPAGEDAELAKDQAARAARLPSVAWRALRQGLETGPVLVQVPRRGYLPAVACQHCRAPARCALPPTRSGVPYPGHGSEDPQGTTPGGGKAQDARGAALVPASTRGAQGPSAGPGTARGAQGPSAGPASTRGAQGTVPGAGDASGARGTADGGGDGPGAAVGSGGRYAGPGAGNGPDTAGGSGRFAVPEALPFSGRRSPQEGLLAPKTPPRSGSPREGLVVPEAAVPAPGGTEGAGPPGSCHGPLALRAGHAAPYCRWCGRVDPGWRCARCGSPRLRAVVVGARRTAEELGRAFPSVPVRTSGRDGVLATVPATRALVVATPGAEPVAEGGYAAAVLLDGWALLGRADLRAAEEALRRWMNAAALLRPAAELVVLADAAVPAVQALLRWDPVTYAERELADRAELGFPPAVRMATLTGLPAAVRQMLDEARLPAAAQVLGPVPVDDGGQERAMIRVPRAEGAALAAALKGAVGVRTARKAPDVVKVSVDPLDLI
ncbi:primosomal protein N' [Nonomuraea muscovyensis]|uniref:primosomal protein N' n=1 Tax=Nonomuraea muscovyensis TaxID=1124761 RepID=UPI003F4CD68D